MRRKIMVCLAAMLLAVSTALAYWPKEQPLHCQEKNVNCQLLQMVMQGRFTDLAPEDNLSIRVYAACLPRLMAITEEDFVHFREEFSEAADGLESCLQIAIGHCLWADILAQPEGETVRATAIRQVLLLFLKPPQNARDVEERATIRSQMTEELLAEMVALTGVSPALLEHLLYSENWKETETME